jgi:mono/diheme cytochrome c family protein
MVRRLVLYLPLVGLALLGAVPPMGASTAATAAAPDSAGFEATVQPFLQDTCVPCHNARRKRGGLNLEPFTELDSVARDPNAWEKALTKIRSGEMPPEDDPQPDERTVAAVSGWIDRELDRVDRLAAPDPGRVTIRRLNRAEYNNTVRDLLGVDLRPADDFPQDDAGYGFDNIGAVLSVSPVLMERYLVAAERVARTAVFGPERLKATLVRKNTGPRKVVEVTTVPAQYDTTGLSVPNAAHAMHRFPVDGEYLVRVIAGGTRPAGSEPIEFTLWLDGHPVATQSFDPAVGASFADDQQDMSGKTVEFRLRVSAGEHWVAVAIPHMFDGLPPSYDGPNPSRRPIPPPPEFRPPRTDPTPERIAAKRKEFDEERAKIKPANNARVSNIEIGGPYDQATGPIPEARRKVFVCGHAPGHHTALCARQIVTSLLGRAFRRPVGADEVQRYLALYRGARQKGDSFDEGIVVVLQGVLVSPDFLFRIERDRATATGPAAPVSEHELATRLSYFLWASMPDQPLRRRADAHALRLPGALEDEIQRMLKDPRSRALVSEFGGQWLQFRALENVKPDVEKFPEFDPYLRLSMREETERFFSRIVHEDRSILEFLNADYTFMNERLARHYGIPDIQGPEFRLVTLPDARRGGVLTQGSVLTVSSYSTRTSPVLRGRWVLDNLLDAPPPDPPPNVPNINEKAVGETATMRQQMEAHRSNATCAACHRRMDPLGFGLENFDAIGQWRTMDGKLQVDASGMLPDGRTFTGPAELRTILQDDREAFAKCMTAKMLTYALGRGLEPGDRRIVRMIARRLPAYDYRFSGLVLEIARSLPFQMRRGVATP